MTVRLLQGDVRARLTELPDESVHCVVTSPPYWALRSYLADDDLGKAYEMGSEPTLQAWIDGQVEVFRAVRRVMRADGTLWLNLGDAYASGGMSNPSDKSTLSGSKDRGASHYTIIRKPPPGLKPKDLIGQPWRLALALQADGWWLRSDIIWAKPNPMPGSQRDRPTTAHEHVFLLTKALRYFYDDVAVRQLDKGSDHPRNLIDPPVSHMPGAAPQSQLRKAAGRNGEGATLRDVWTIPTEPLPYEHYAAFPSEIPRRAILAGTSAKGVCPMCGAPWVREVAESFNATSGPKKAEELDPSSGWAGWPRGTTERTTTGWRLICAHEAEPVPATCLDPFSGAGTTLLVADQLQRDAIGIELNPKSVEITRERLESGKGAAPLFTEAVYG